jgi:hypothetical protein
MSAQLSSVRPALPDRDTAGAGFDTGAFLVEWILAWVAVGASSVCVVVGVYSDWGREPDG